MTSSRVPQTVQISGLIGIAQSVVGLCFAGFLSYRELTGQQDSSIVYATDNANTWVGYGTAIFFGIIFGATLVGALSMIRGRKWGRGPVITLNLILLPITYYMFTEGRYLWAIVTGASAIVCLALLFSAQSVRWAAENY